MDNLLMPPDPLPPTRLSIDHPEADAALAGGTDPRTVAAQWPGHLAAWATLADQAYDEGDPIGSYAFARTGYHRGLDALRRNGWKGTGPVPWAHEPNQGFLRSLHALGRAAAAIGETPEAERCAGFLADCDAEAVKNLRL